MGSWPRCTASAYVGDNFDNIPPGLSDLSRANSANSVTTTSKFNTVNTQDPDNKHDSDADNYVMTKSSAQDIEMSRI